MDALLITRERSLLRARFQSLTTCPPATFGDACARLLSWLRAHPMFGPQLAILSQETKRNPRLVDMENRLISNTTSTVKTIAKASTYDEHAAIGLKILELVSGREIERQKDHFAAMAYGLTGEQAVETPSIAAVLANALGSALYPHLDNVIDEQFAVLSILRKYKQRSEWYRRAQLRAMADGGFAGRSTGELSLMMDLYEFVFDQGVDFYVESKSASGRADLVSAEAAGGRRLVLDGKYIRPRHGEAAVRKIVAQGLRQVSEYCRDQSQSIGYLLVYVNQDLNVQLGAKPSPFPEIEVGSVTISCIWVNIFGYALPASKRPPPRVQNISRPELLTDIGQANLDEDIPEDM